MRSIVVINLKGGSGKTTTAINLAVAMARKLRGKQRLLLCDTDPSANSTFLMTDGKQPKGPTLTDVLLEEADAIEAIRPVARLPHLDILPANASLANCAPALLGGLGSDRRLRAALRTVEDRYTVCLLDASPSWSLLSLNSLVAAQDVIIPVDAGVFSIAGLGRLQETVEQVRRHLEHPELTIVSLVMVRADVRNKATAALLSQLREAYGELVSKVVIPFGVQVEAAHARFRTVLEWAPRAPVSVAYEALTKEIQKNGHIPKRHSRRSRSRNPHAA